MQEPGRRKGPHSDLPTGPTWWLRAAAGLVVAVACLALPLPAQWNSRIVFAYAVGITVLCALTYRVVALPRREQMPSFARNEGSPNWGPLLGAGVVALTSLGALIYLLRTVTHQPPGIKALHLAITIYGVLVSWVTLHTLFALRYAALYYAPAPEDPDHPARGLTFPDPNLTPDYWDFLYYAFTIGMCYQTSDVSVVSPVLRRYTLVHSVFAYLYGVGILSLLISTVGGVF